jgi:ATP-dependent Clp protease adaptor protein ClpS
MKNNMNKEYTASLVLQSEYKEPSLYQVLLHNDDFTPREFVLTILEKFFYMERARANEVLIVAQAKGKAVCGIFAKDFAEAKVDQVVEYATQYDHPLHCSMEIA